MFAVKYWDLSRRYQFFELNWKVWSQLNSSVEVSVCKCEKLMRRRKIQVWQADLNWKFLVVRRAFGLPKNPLVAICRWWMSPEIDKVPPQSRMCVHWILTMLISKCFDILVSENEYTQTWSRRLPRNTHTLIIGVQTWHITSCLHSRMRTKVTPSLRLSRRVSCETLSREMSSRICLRSFWRVLICSWIRNE